MVAATNASVSANTLREKAQPVIEEATRRLVAEFQPEQVWLFGSYAWGEPTEDSDLDFAVVLNSSEERSLRLMQRGHKCLRGLGMPKDVLVSTVDAFERNRHLRPTLTYKIANEGLLMYER